MGEANEQRKWEREEVVILVTEYFRTKNLSQEEIANAQKQITLFVKLDVSKTLYFCCYTSSCFD